MERACIILGEDHFKMIVLNPEVANVICESLNKGNYNSHFYFVELPIIDGKSGESEPQYKTTHDIRHYNHRPEETGHVITLTEVMNKIEYLTGLVKHLVNETKEDEVCFIRGEIKENK